MWNGLPSLAGVIGYDLYRVVRTDDGTKPALLNSGELLPLAGSFVDFTSQLPSLDLTTLDAALAAPSIKTSQVKFDALDVFLAGFDGPPYAEAQGVAQWVSETAYFLVGVLATGQRDGPKAPKKPDLTDEEKKTVDASVAKALDEIKKRKLIEGAKPNPDNTTYDDLKKNVTVTVEKTDTPGSEGDTTPSGLAVKGTLKAKSDIRINGPAAKGVSDEELIALLFHEMLHALRNLHGVPAPDADTVAVAANTVASEADAFSGVWDAIKKGDIKLDQAARVQEIKDAIAEMLLKFAAFSGEITKATAGKGLTDAQKTAIQEAKDKTAQALQKYVDYIKSLPDADQKKLTVPDPGGGADKPLADYLNDQITQLKK